MTLGWKEDLGKAPGADRPTCSSCADHTTLATWENGLKIMNIIIIITKLSLSSSGLTCCRRGFHVHGLVGCSRRPSRGRTSCQVLQDFQYSYCSKKSQHSENISGQQYSRGKECYKEFVGTLEEMVGDFLRHGVIESLCHLQSSSSWLSGSS